MRGRGEAMRTHNVVRSAAQVLDVNLARSVSLVRHPEILHYLSQAQGTASGIGL